MNSEPDRYTSLDAALRDHLGDGDHTPDMVLTSMGDPAPATKGEQLVANLAPAAEAGAKVVFIADNPAAEWLDGGEKETLQNVAQAGLISAALDW